MKMFAPEGNAAKIILLSAATSVLSNFLEGYCSAYPNTADNGFEEFLNSSFRQRSRESAGLSQWSYTWFWSTFLNVWFVGFLIGTLSTPLIADRYGRRTSILIANFVNLCSTLISTFAIIFFWPEALVAGRVVGAAGSGLSMNSLILFVQETVPTRLRGTCSFLSEGTFIAANVLGMGMGMDVLFGRNLAVLIGLAAIPSLLGILVMIPLEESPKFLLINRNNRKAALKALTYYQGHEINHSEVLEQMLKESDTSRIDLPIFQAIKEVLRQAYLRKAIAIGILSLQIIVGIWPIIYNSTELLEVHMDAKFAQLSSFIFIMANFLASIVGMWAVERFGRRPMLLYCGVANTIFLFLFVIFDQLAEYYTQRYGIGCVLSLVGYGVTYGVAVGPIAAFITTELVPQRCRSLVQSMVYSVNTIIIFVLSFVTLPIYRLISVWAFIPLFVLPSCFSLFYLFVALPETRGREIYDIVAELMLRQSATRGAISPQIVTEIAPKLVHMDSMPNILPKAQRNAARRSNGALDCWKRIFERRRAKAKQSNATTTTACRVECVPRVVVKSASNTTLSFTLDELCASTSATPTRRTRPTIMATFQL